MMSRTYRQRDLEPKHRSMKRVRIIARDPVDCGKVRYQTYDMAVAKALLHVTAEVREPARQLQPYECRRCSGWHLTSKPWRNTLAQYPAIEAT